MSASARRRRPFLDADRPLLFAHRGGGALCPENTLTAFENALDRGVPFLETDVRMTRDGVLVVLHDETVDRTTDGTGSVRDLRHAELSQLDAGYRFSADGGLTFPFRGRGIRIPTLSQVFALSGTARINVEIKAPGRRIVRRLWELVDGHGWHDRILIAAHDDRQVRRFRRYSRERVATSAGMKETLGFWTLSRLGVERFFPVKYDALQVPPSYYGLEVIDRKFVMAAHRHGLQVHAWTIDESSEMRRLLNLGVDGLMSDRPDRLVSMKRTGG